MVFLKFYVITILEIVFLSFDDANAPIITVEKLTQIGMGNYNIFCKLLQLK